MKYLILIALALSLLSCGGANPEFDNAIIKEGKDLHTLLFKSVMDKKDYKTVLSPEDLKTLEANWILKVPAEEIAKHAASPVLEAKTKSSEGFTIVIYGDNHADIVGKD